VVKKERERCELSLVVSRRYRDSDRISYLWFNIEQVLVDCGAVGVSSTKKMVLFSGIPTQALNFSKGSSTFDYTTVHLDDPPRFYPYGFEVFDWKEWCRYVSLNWHFCLYAGLVYITAIFGIKGWMKGRPAFDLKPQLFLWNAALGVFSIIGFVRTAPEFFSIVLDKDGFYRSICVR